MTEEIEEMVIEGDPTKTININKELPTTFKKSLSEIFHKFEDVFTWYHTELKGVDPKVCQHN